ncbi:putative holin-like toxin [Streptococcus pyogenes]
MSVYEIFIVLINYGIFLLALLTYLRKK